MRVLKPCRNYCEIAMEYGEDSPITMQVCENCPWQKEMDEYEAWKSRTKTKKGKTK